MNSVRVHTIAEPRANAGYLVLADAPNGRIRIHLERLAHGYDVLGEVLLSRSLLEDVLRGCEAIVAEEGGTLRMVAEAEVLCLTFQPKARPPLRSQYVWLAEVALAWNLLCREDPPPSVL